MAIRAIRSAAAAAFLTATSALVAGAAAAQTSFPQKPVKIILPFSPGGASDVLARQIAEDLRKTWKQPVIVENRTGASGILAADAVAKADPDGYTALLTVTALVQTPSLYEKPSYDPIKDFAPVSQVGTMPLAFVVSAASPIKTLGEFIAAARAKPNDVSYGSFGIGSAGHLYLELLQDAAKIRLIHVPYKGETPTLQDLIGGQISGAIVSVPGAKPMADAGKIRALAVTGESRTAQLPEVPSFAEAGYSGVGLESIGWYGLLLPAKTPPEVVDKFSRDLNAVLKQPDFRQRMQTYGIKLTGTTPAEFSEIIKSDYARWTKVIRDNNIKAN
ncbi:tripartite tricarboxylate transporter substrate binding protein [Achromobacter pestifer]|uniref:Tripartite tricarboxylate transporter substrate binding protein n=1 Tax=Achromobacter pestifer TaxID=1353889 RepID=A0A7D4E021_9BURK|nr:tripartite tricarboxylate transporter substrate binding protein [Achromobacter pestifer]QKH36887.1 tripartite tricarboxylate transporter substrate binding protein [Achromobacter pestifer]